MANIMWRQHDRILAFNWEIAREVYSHVKAVDLRLKRDLQYTNDGRQRASIQARRHIIHAYADVAQRTWDLYEWARNDEGKVSRPEYPWDTEPAAQSKYAEALGLAMDQNPTLPMRGVMRLQDILLEAYVEAAQL